MFFAQFLSDFVYITRDFTTIDMSYVSYLQEARKLNLVSSATKTTVSSDHRPRLQISVGMNESLLFYPDSGPGSLASLSPAWHTHPASLSVLPSSILLILLIAE